MMETERPAAAPSKGAGWSSPFLPPVVGVAVGERVTVPTLPVPAGARVLPVPTGTAGEVVDGEVTVGRVAEVTTEEVTVEDELTVDEVVETASEPPVKGKRPM